MSLVNEYFLWYKVWNRHELLKNAQRQIMIDGYQHANSKQMAEYFLNALDFDSRTGELTRQLRRQGVGVDYSADYVADKQIERVHEACGEQVRSGWGMPQISREQFERTLFLDAAKNELEEIPKKFDTELHF